SIRRATILPGSIWSMDPSLAVSLRRVGSPGVASAVEHAAAGAVAGVGLEAEVAPADVVPQGEPLPARRRGELLLVGEEGIREQDRHLLFPPAVEQAESPAVRGAVGVEPAIEIGLAGPAVEGQLAAGRGAGAALVLADAEVEVEVAEV